MKDRDVAQDYSSLIESWEYIQTEALLAKKAAWNIAHIFEPKMGVAIYRLAAQEIEAMRDFKVMALLNAMSVPQDVFQAALKANLLAQASMN